MNAPLLALGRAPDLGTDLALHVVGWDESAFRPEAAPAETVAAALGDGVRPLALRWLDGQADAADHRCLLAETGDRRLEAAAYALANGFARESPSLLIPGLLDAAGRETAADGLAALARHLADHGRPAVLILAGLATPDAPDPRPGLDRLAEALATRGLTSPWAEVRVIRAPAGSPLDLLLRRNHAARSLAAQLARLAPEAGWEVASPDRLTQACAQALRAAAERGLAPAATLDADGLRRLALGLAPTVLHGAGAACES